MNYFDTLYDTLYPRPMETPIFTGSPYPITTEPNLVNTLEQHNIYNDNIDNSISSIISSTPTTPVPTQMITLNDSLLYDQINNNTNNIENFLNTVMISHVPKQIYINYTKLSSRDKRFIDSIINYSDYININNFNIFITNENIDYKREKFYRLLLDYMQSVLIDDPYHKYGFYLEDEHIFRLECIINILYILKTNIRTSNISDEDMMFYFAYIDEKNNKVNNAIDNYINNVVTDSNLKNKYNSYKNVNLTFNKPNNYLLTSQPTVSVIQ